MEDGALFVRTGLRAAGVAIAALVLAVATVACGSEPRGEILLVGVEPSGPVWRDGDRLQGHAFVRVEDGEALRARFDSSTRAIVFDVGRFDEVGDEWLARRYAEGIVIATLDLPLAELLDRVGAGDQAPVSAEPEPSRLMDHFSVVSLHCGSGGSSAISGHTLIAALVDILHPLLELQDFHCDFE